MPFAVLAHLRRSLAGFARRGLGQLLIQGIRSNDFPVIQAVVLIVAIVYIISNILVDVSYAVIDPRVRVSVLGSKR